MKTQIDSELLALAKHALMTEYYTQFSQLANEYLKAGEGLDYLEESMSEVYFYSREDSTNQLPDLRICVERNDEPFSLSKRFDSIVEALTFLIGSDCMLLYINGTKYFEKVDGEIMWAKCVSP